MTLKPLSDAFLTDCVKSAGQKGPKTHDFHEVVCQYLNNLISAQGPAKRHKVGLGHQDAGDYTR